MANSRWCAYWQLMRFDKPIGTLLLLWPTLWGLWLASRGWPDGSVLIIFCSGVVIMRAAGCVINDFADRHIDGHVSRTQQRPLATGLIAPWQALVLFTALCSLALGLVLLLPPLCLKIASIALGLAIIYPFCKRCTHFPQVVLGLAWYLAIPMAYAAVQQTVPPVAWVLYLTAAVWTVAYDTQYAMVDREDDLQIGVKSTAIWAGHFDKAFIGLCQILVIVLLASIAISQQLTQAFWWLLLLTSLHFIYQQYLIKNRNPQACFQAFLSNNTLGALIFMGFFLGV